MGRKSAKIANRKGAADRARGLVYTRALKDVFKASKGGGSDPASNFLLKVALERARKLNVPRDNIEKAIKKGQGGGGTNFQDISYEGYGPGGIALFVEASTDNPTRTVGNMRSYFKKCNGTLGNSGSLEFVFSRIAKFKITAEGLNEDDFTMHMLDAGAEDIQTQGKFFLVTGPMSAFGAIQSKLQEVGTTPETASLVRIPLTKKTVTDEEVLEEYDKLVDMIEEDDDVVAVFNNLEGEDEEEDEEV